MFDGVSSGWSKTQTLTINKNSNDISNQTSDNSGMYDEPKQPSGFTWIQLVTITT
ncbi:MAG: hypothetical protein LBE76_07220 [Nitrososphaerota archaeon]|nr:hypothetical protein [Nitrososphaerota archaeon]